MGAMRFDYRDLFRSARLAFSFQRIWIQFIGLLCGYSVFVVLTYLAHLAAGRNLGILWTRYGFFPFLSGVHFPWYSLILFIIGALFLLFAWMVTSTAVARATYMHLKGNVFYTWKEAVRFAVKKKGGSVISTPIAITLIIFFVGLGGVVVGLAGQIPFIGEIGLSIFTVIWFVTSVFLTFLLLALIVSLILSPSIIATTDDDAFEGIFQSFSSLYSQPWRLILYELLLGVIAIIGLAVFAFFAKKAWDLMTVIFLWGMGGKYADLSYAASYLLQSWVYPAVIWARAILGEYTGNFFFARDFAPLDLRLTMQIASWIYAIFLVFIGGFIFSYPLAVFNVGNTQIFLILKKKKDDENLLDRKDKEEDEEENPEEMSGENDSSESGDKPDNESGDTDADVSESDETPKA